MCGVSDVGLFVGSTPVKQVYVGNTPVTAVYVGSQKVWPTIEVHEVTLTNVSGSGAVHPLLTVTVPAGETWNVRIQGTVTKASNVSSSQPFFRIGTAESGKYGPGAAVDFSGTVTAANSAIALVANGYSATSFVGTVTIEK